MEIRKKRAGGIRYVFVIFLFCMTVVPRLFSQTCFVKKINNERIQAPLWTGPCKDSLATGEGILYDSWNKMRYRGEMQGGLPQGYGAWYGKYSIEGNWWKGKPANVGYYLREVRFSEEDGYVYVDNGFRCLLNRNKGLTDETLNMSSKPDTIDFAERLSADSTYVPFPSKKKKRNLAPPPDYYASSVFFLDESGKNGGFVVYSYKRFLVRCKYSGELYVLYLRESTRERGEYLNVWQWEPFERKDAPKYYSAYEAMKAQCQCD